MTTNTLTGARWSSATQCPRMSAYQALGVEGEPHSLETEQRFGRGRRIGQAMAQEVIETLTEIGRQAVPEYEVPWGPGGIWTGHVDVMEVDERLGAIAAIEVVSTEGAVLPPNKARQVAAYSIFSGRANFDQEPDAFVLSVDPKTGDQRTYPINVGSFREEVEAIERAVVTAYEGGPLPDRFDGASPGSWPCRECQFRLGCMADYQPPPAGRLPGRQDDFLRLAELDGLIKSTPRGDHVIEYEAERDQLREFLAGLMEPGTDYIEGGVRLRRTEVKGRRSFDFTAAENAGWSLPDDIDPFVKQTKGHNTWTLREVGE